MATILTPAPAHRPDLSSRLCVLLASGLVALVIGVALLLDSALLPAFASRPVMVPAEAAIQLPTGPNDVGNDTTGMRQSPGHLPPTVDRLATDRRSPAPTTPHRIGADLETALARGTRAESAHLATILLHPDGWDVRRDLMEMAAAQRRDWTVHCLCPVYSVDVPPRSPR
jgi:hypothetical protein